MPEDLAKAVKTKLKEEMAKEDGIFIGVTINAEEATAEEATGKLTRIPNELS